MNSLIIDLNEIAYRRENEVFLPSNVKEIIELYKENGFLLTGVIKDTFSHYCSIKNLDIFDNLYTEGGETLKEIYEKISIKSSIIVSDNHQWLIEWSSDFTIKNSKFFFANVFFKRYQSISYEG